MASQVKTKVRQPKNRTAAADQITAEQILREAFERTEAPARSAPKQDIRDHEELDEYRLRKRKEFEDHIRRSRHAMNVWSRYAKWEESQKDVTRARSIWERALEVEPTNQGLWVKYAEMEMRNKNINSARNVLDRAVTYLPRVNQFWLKYIHMEDMLANYAGVRQLYQRWMEWMPDELAWTAFLKFELRNGEFSRARDIYVRFVKCHPKVNSYLKWAKFEETQGDPQRAREVYEAALEHLEEEAYDATLFSSFAAFEERCKEYERARGIYKFALDHLPKHLARDVYKTFIQFEKKFGTKEGIEDVILNKRRFQYEEELKSNASNYDIWFDYLRLEEPGANFAKIRDVYERAVSNVPPTGEKRFWRRYIYLWINYAIFEEVEAKDAERAREVYRLALQVVPHKKFSFPKLWVMAAHFEVRQKNLAGARKVFGNAIGIAPSEKLFKAYIELELSLGEVNKCRGLYEKWIEVMPFFCNAWKEFAELEKNLREFDRARAIFKLAINQTELDMPELIWKAYIDFEVELQKYDHARELYQQLLARTQHVKVWISYARFEMDVGNTQKARDVYTKAFNVLKQEDMKAERVILIESWFEFEQLVGDPTKQKEVAAKMPRRVTKRRKVTNEAGEDAGWEEYFDYIFPDEETAKPNLKLLQAAHKWKQQQATGEAGTAPTAPAPAAAPQFVRSAEPTDSEDGDS